MKRSLWLSLGMLALALASGVFIHHANTAPANKYWSTAQRRVTTGQSQACRVEPTAQHSKPLNKRPLNFSQPRLRPSVVNQTCPVTALSLPQTVNGALSSTDCNNATTGRYFDLYSFSATAGQQIAILLTSTQYDTYLVLLDANGNLIAEDDDGGGGTNSRIPADSGYLSLTASGTYTVIVSSFDEGALGNYTLSLMAATSTTVTLQDHRMTGGPFPSDCTPPPAKTSFAPTDETAYHWVFVSGARSTDSARWEFYQPNGSLYAQTQPLMVNYNGEVCFWGGIYIAGQNAASLPGTWQVRAYYNDVLLVTNTFTISGNSTPTPTPTPTVTPTPSPSPGQCLTPPAGLISWWPGDGNANDIQGGNNAATQGGVTYTTAKAGQGFNFANDADRVSAPHNANLNVQTPGFTADFWMRGVKNQPQSLAVVFEKSHGFVDSTGWFFQCDSTSGKISYGIGAGGSGISNFPNITSSTDVLDGNFHLVAGTWDGSTLRLYVDGVLQNTLTFTSPVNNTRPVNIGFASGGGTPQRFFRGVVDEAEVFSRALSATEIQALYTAGSAGKCKSSPGNCVQPPAGVYGWWPGDGNANDTTSAHHGTLKNGATYTTGQVGQAFQFDGENDYVDLGGFVPGAQWTLEAWVKPSALPTTRRAILGSLNSCADWALVLQDGKFGLALKPATSACTDTLTSGVTAVAGTWYHLVGTSDGTTARIYVNGELKGSVPVSANYLGSTAGTWIGGDVCCTEFFPGSIDEPTIFNRALTASEALALYNAGSAGKCKTTTGCAAKADYQFQNTLSSSTGAPPALTNLGVNTFGTTMVEGVSRTVLQFPKDNGVALQPTTGVISNSVYSVVALFSFTDVSGWRRVFDFKHGTDDTGLYLYDGRLNFYSGLGEGMTQIAANSYVQVVLTRDASKLVTVYANGVQQFSFTDSSELAVIDANNSLRFFQDNTTSGRTGEASAGAVARIRVYDCALTPSEVAGLERLPGQTPTCTTITGLNVNRLCNPGAELGQGGTNAETVVSIPGWTTTANFTAIVYGLTEFPTLADAQRIGGGTNLFYGGYNTASSTATQSVEVADEASGIDAGQRTAQLQGYLGGYQPEGDNAQVRAEFLNASGTVLGSALTLGPATGSLQLLTTSGAVPAGTRSIRVTLLSTRVGGSYNEGFFDNLSLALSASGTSTCPTVSNLSPSSGAVGSSVTITGTNFTGVSTVRFTNNVNAQFTINSATQITATVPSGAATGPITLSKPGCTDVQTVPFTITTPQCLDVTISTSLTASTGTTLTVPIQVTDTTGKGVIAYDATITFDATVLRLQSVPTDKTGTLSGNFTITTNSPVSGQLRISAFGSTALTGAGTLLNLKFDVIGAAQTCSNLSFASFRFNEGTPCSTTTNGRACVTGGGIISGAVSYCVSPKGVPGVTLNITGSSTASATTNSSGNYTLPNLNSGNYTLTPSKTGDINGIASFDAALVAQHVVGITTLTACQQAAGDSSNNGELSSFDAAFIAQYVVGINNAANLAGTWKFVPPTRSYTNLSSNQANQNFDAVLVGDVSGNWTPTALLPETIAFTPLNAPTQAVQVSLPDLTSAPGASLILPITVGDLTGRGVIAFDLDLSYDDSVLQAQPDSTDAVGTLSGGFTITANATAGRLRVSGFGTAPLAGSGVLLKLRFNVTGNAGANTALTWQKFIFNEGTPPASLVNGRVTVLSLPTLSFSPATQTLAIGSTGALTLIASTAPTSVLTLNLASSNPAIASVPDQVSLAAGQTMTTFNVTGNAIGGPVMITATLPAAPGLPLANASVTVLRPVACVSAASFLAERLASEAIVAAFGVDMATATVTAATVPLPTSLAGTTVSVLDSEGVARLAPLFFVSAGQINYQVPPGTANGLATITVTSGDGTVSTGRMMIATVAPGLFSANANGQGVPAAVALRVKTDGSQIYEVISTYDVTQQSFVPLPLSLGPEGEQLYLILFGTGVRNVSSLANVQLQIGGSETPVVFIGAVEGLVGLDQLNVGPLPRSLAGRGEVSIVMQVGGQAANPTIVNIR
jgi:uncharacterized protein (TIGR03437 family)